MEKTIWSCTLEEDLASLVDMIAGGVDIDSTNDLGETSLHLASSRGLERAAKVSKEQRRLFPDCTYMILSAGLCRVFCTIDRLRTFVVGIERIFLDVENKVRRNLILC